MNQRLIAQTRGKRRGATVAPRRRIQAWEKL